MRAASIYGLCVGLTLWAACGGGGPVTVAPADAPAELSEAGAGHDAARPVDLATPRDGRAPQDWNPGAGGVGGGIFVVDASGKDVGYLVRRGSDESTAGRSIYDTVTVFHPASGLFFDITMTEAIPLLPATGFFSGAGCATPVGISAGGCATCRAGHGLGFLHEGVWWRVVSGAAREQIANAATRPATADGSCVPHSSSNSPAFPVETVTGTTPPTSFAAPLRFQWR
ncbi:MAG: hypothetical protein R3F39_16280 [Myxococcota bacterium]